ncbi:MAG: hypothetical protein R3C14_29060 [Caldilineaceae bacterium]
MASHENFQLFNLATMAGVFPGARTKLFQRLRVESLVGEPPERAWIQLLWYDQPAACVAYLLPPSVPAGKTDATQPIAHKAGAYKEGGAEVAEQRVLLRLPDPSAGDLNQRLQAALYAAGWQLLTCGSCAHWQRTALVNPDGLATGDCRWRSGDTGAETAGAQATPLMVQGEFALLCSGWRKLTGATTMPVADGKVPAPGALTPLAKAAESAEIRLPWWQRWRNRWRRRRMAPSAQRALAVAWETSLVERSGVGAGTEPCFACQGRIANLGALTTATPEGDKETFSVWRCRHCYTLYLNHWIDRWERLDTLETEERYYRVAPAEARALLALIHQAPGAEHPHRRQERQAERSYFLDFLAGRAPLSHQIRQGR